MERKSGVHVQGVRTELRHGGTHLVQLLRAYVRAVGETKVNEAPFPEQILLREWLAVMCRHFERPTDVRASDGARFGLLLCSDSFFENG
jgi:hypothetical protein